MTEFDKITNGLIVLAQIAAEQAITPVITCSAYGIHVDMGGILEPKWRCGALQELGWHMNPWVGKWEYRMEAC